MDFFGEFKKLVLSRPHQSTSSRTAENSTFGDFLYTTKNIYLGYFLKDCQDCFYSEHLTKCRDCIDCCYLMSSDLALECQSSSNLYDCSFLQDCNNCSFVNYSYDCVNCKYCFGCQGLRHQQFRVFNKQYGEKEYYEKLAELKKQSPQKIAAILTAEFQKTPRLFSNTPKDCFKCFDVVNTNSSAYCADILHPANGTSDCYDYDFVDSVNSCYSCQNVSASENCSFLNNCINCQDCAYCSDCYNCQNCFGCAYVQNKQFCVLNRQLTRDEYFLAIRKIKDELKTAGLYGKNLADILI
jgi:hypothetical protein